MQVRQQSTSKLSVKHWENINFLTKSIQHVLRYQAHTSHSMITTEQVFKAKQDNVSFPNFNTQNANET